MCVGLSLIARECLAVSSAKVVRKSVELAQTDESDGRVV